MRLSTAIGKITKSDRFFRYARNHAEQSLRTDRRKKRFHHIDREQLNREKGQALLDEVKEAAYECQRIRDWLDMNGY